MRRFQPALLGGLFIGMLSSLPVVNYANYCCCLWVVVGGLLTVYLQRQSPVADVVGGGDAAEAALGGLTAGAVGAVIYVLFSWVLFSLSGDAIVAEAESALDRFGQVPPEVRDRVLSLLTGGAYIFVVAAVTLPIYAVFSMLGALLGLAIFRKKPAPPSTEA
jgi:hypothetical protein